MRLGARAYRAILLLYPDDLRLGFGDDMTEAFSDDLACAWRGRDVLGIATVWWYAAFEVFTVAIPGRLANPALRARAVSAAVHIALLAGVLAIAAIHDFMPSHAWHGVIELKTAELHPRPSGERR